jgi:hypothetical protein
MRLESVMRLEGQIRDGAPDGQWQLRNSKNGEDSGHLLVYKRGELVDWHYDGQRRLPSLNAARKARGLAELSERDFADDTRG